MPVCRNERFTEAANAGFDASAAAVALPSAIASAADGSLPTAVPATAASGFLTVRVSRVLLGFRTGVSAPGTTVADVRTSQSTGAFRTAVARAVLGHFTRREGSATTTDATLPAEREFSGVADAPL